MSEELKNVPQNSSNSSVTNNPVIRISIAMGIGDKANMSMETYVDAITPTEVINALTDKLFFVGNRQAAIAEVKGMERFLEGEENQLAALLADLDRENKRQEDLRANAPASRVAYKLSEKDAQALKNIKVNVSERNRRNAKLKEDIRARKVALGMEI